MLSLVSLKGAKRTVKDNLVAALSTGRAVALSFALMLGMPCDVIADDPDNFNWVSIPNWSENAARYLDDPVEGWSFKSGDSASAAADSGGVETLCSIRYEGTDLVIDSKTAMATDGSTVPEDSVTVQYRGLERFGIASDAEIRHVEYFLEPRGGERSPVAFHGKASSTSGSEGSFSQGSFNPADDQYTLGSFLADFSQDRSELLIVVHFSDGNKALFVVDVEDSMDVIEKHRACVDPRVV